LSIAARQPRPPGARPILAYFETLRYSPANGRTNRGRRRGRGGTGGRPCPDGGRTRGGRSRTRGLSRYADQQPQFRRHPRGNLPKARLCVRGKELLYEYCARRGVAHRRCGKLIVAATGAEVAVLLEYRARARDSGAGALEPLSAAQVAALEHARAAARGFHLSIDDGRNTRVRCRELVIAAGLHAPAVAARIAGLDPGRVPAARFARGRYYVLSGAVPFNRLIYPIAGAGDRRIGTVPLRGRSGPTPARSSLGARPAPYSECRRRSWISRSYPLPPPRNRGHAA
jgi:hypothetical protein